jgi:ABC-type multidrug transport system fused ATPase/permease subunit
MSPETRNTVLQGIEEARQGQFAVAPDLEADLSMSQRSARTFRPVRTLSPAMRRVVTGLIVVLVASWLLVMALMLSGCGKKFTAVPSTQPITRAIEAAKSNLNKVAPADKQSAEHKANTAANLNTATDESQKLDRANARLIQERDEAVATKDRAEAKYKADLAEAKERHERRQAEIRADYDGRWYVIWGKRVQRWLTYLILAYIAAGVGSVAAIIWGGPAGLLIGKTVLSLIPGANLFSWAANKWGQ